MYRKEVIKSFEVFTPTTNQTSAVNNLPSFFSDTKGLSKEIVGNVNYSIINSDNDDLDVVYHMPVILTECGVEGAKFANRFLIEKVKQVSKERIHGYADSLCRFLNFCEDESINYLECRSFVRSPLTRYSNELHYRQCKKSYIKDELSRLVAFYNYLIEKCSVQFKSSPFGDKKERKHWYQVDTGLEKKTVGKDYTTTTIQESVKGTGKKTSEKANYHGTVHDSGEDLRPLEKYESKILFQALSEINNIEATLAHQIAIGTGGRKQTVLTLRHIHFERELNDIEDNIPIVSSISEKTKEETEVSSLIDAKGDRRFVMYFPREIYLAVQRYIQSERAGRRYQKARPYNNPLHQYVFISERGNPYYLSKRDPYRVLYRHPPSGGTLDRFINNRLKPLMEQLGFEDPNRCYKFHDCRATFGMMRLESQLSNVDNEKKETESNIGKIYDNILRNVQRYMNHKQLRTTMQYLDLRKNKGLLHCANEDFAKALKDVACV